MRVSDRWHFRIARDSRYNDNQKGRTIDPTIEYITPKYLQSLQKKQQNLCHYCQTPMNWLRRRDRKNGLTVERSDNNLAHYRSNCKSLCCKSCNSRRLSYENGLLLRYFSKWKNLVFDSNVYVQSERRPGYTM